MPVLVDETAPLAKKGNDRSGGARRPRLRRISAANAAASSELFWARDVLVSGAPPLAWRFAPGRAMALPAIVLQGQLGKILMSLAEDALRDPVGAREWW